MGSAKRLFLCILSYLGKNATHEDSTFIYLGIMYFIRNVCYHPTKYRC